MLRVILVVKSKLSPWIDSAAFEQMKPFLKKNKVFKSAIDRLTVKIYSL